MPRHPATILGLALVSSLAVPACGVLGLDADVLSIDAARRGFEVPARPVIVFYVDGLRKDVFETLASNGEMPRLRRHLLDRAASVRSAVASVPSLTYTNAVSMLTGCWPSSHDVWSNVWFDRDQLLTRNYDDDCERADSDLVRPSMFELYENDLTASVALPFKRASKISLASSARSAGRLAWLSWAFNRKKDADRILAEQMYEIGEQARQIGEWPAFIAVHLPATDNTGHEEGCDTEKYRKAVANLEAGIGEVLETLANGGMLETLTIVLTSDHGHHPTPRSFQLDEFLNNELQVPILHAEDNDGDDSYLDRFERYSPQRGVLITNGERVASLHLRRGESWRERPGLEEILAFPGGAGREGSTLPDRLLNASALGLIAVRDGVDAVRVHGRLGVAAIERERVADGDVAFRYRVLSGEDPLEYRRDARLASWIDEGAHPSREWLAATAELDYPDAVPQLSMAFDHVRSGDVLLFAAPGWGFSDEYAGGHGALAREEMLVPLYIAGPGIRSGAEVPAARLVDLVPTLIELVGLEIPPATRFDGVSFAPLLR